VRIRFCLNVASILLALYGCSGDDENQPDDNYGEQLMTGINNLRMKGCFCGSDWMPAVEPLTRNTSLETAALNHARDMIDKNYFSHISPGGTAPVDRAINAGYTGNQVGEIIARRYTSTESVIQGWKESESHCKAMMDSIYNEMGGARAQDHWVVDLGG
jgi:uncharacterized protein YkwD